MRNKIQRLNELRKEYYEATNIEQKVEINNERLRILEEISGYV